MLILIIYLYLDKQLSRLIVSGMLFAGMFHQYTEFYYAMCFSCNFFEKAI
jgi:hypothetical protein